MFIRTIKLEKKGLKEFWAEERQLKELARQEWWNSVLPFRVYSTPSEEYTDLEFEGGGPSRARTMKPGQRRKSTAHGALSLGGSQSQTNVSGPWHDLSKEEKKIRIDQLWAKARRYNNKLRLQARL